MGRNRIDNREIGITESMRMHGVLDEILYGRDPFAEIERLMACGLGDDVTAFERYAGAVLRHASADQLLKGPMRNRLKLLEPGDGRLAQIACSTRLQPHAQSLLERTECAVNRLICIADAIDDGIRDTAPQGDDHCLSISFLGPEYRRARANYRSAQVVLPDMPLGEHASFAYYNEVDWRVYDSITSHARSIYQRTIMPNTRQAVFGASAPNRSDWDVRTRLAFVLDGLELPFRCAFRFDCDVSAGQASVRFACPPAWTLPETLAANDELQGVEKLSGRHIAFVMRLACLMAAACFGSGLNIERAFVAAMDEHWEHALLSGSFERQAFVRSVLAAIDDRSATDPAMRCDPEALAHIIAPNEIVWTERADTQCAPQQVDGIERQRIPAHEDVRELPADLQELFRMRRVCDLDTSHYLGGYAEEVDEARRDSDDSVVASIARLEHIVAELEQSLHPPADDPTARPLYCPHAPAHLALGLLDDEFSVSAEAESFLHGEGEADPNTEHAPLPHYFRAPSALFHAHMGLSDLYQRIGDFAGAEMHANRCLAIAPTAAWAYFRKADIIAEQQKYSQAANVFVAGLRCAVTQPDSALLYYYLGLLLWNLGKERESTAVHVYNASLTGEFAEKSARVVAGLRKREGASVIAHASPLAAMRELERMRIPVAPVEMPEKIAQAAVGLANFDAPMAAAPYAELLAHLCRTDRIIVAACRSLQHGTDLV